MGSSNSPNDYTSKLASLQRTLDEKKTHLREVCKEQEIREQELAKLNRCLHTREEEVRLNQVATNAASVLLAWENSFPVADNELTARAPACNEPFQKGAIPTAKGRSSSMPTPPKLATQTRFPRPMPRPKSPRRVTQSSPRRWRDIGATGKPFTQGSKQWQTTYQTSFSMMTHP